MRSKISVTIVANDLSLGMKQTMLQIYNTTTNKAKDHFLEDLNLHQYVVLYRRNGLLQGFAFINTETTKLNGQSIFLINLSVPIISVTHHTSKLIRQTHWTMIQKFWRQTLTSKSFLWTVASDQCYFQTFTQGRKKYFTHSNRPHPPEVTNTLALLTQKQQSTSSIEHPVSPNPKLPKDQKVLILVPFSISTFITIPFPNPRKQPKNVEQPLKVQSYKAQQQITL